MLILNSMRTSCPSRNVLLVNLPLSGLPGHGACAHGCDSWAGPIQVDSDDVAGQSRVLYLTPPPQLVEHVPQGNHSLH